MTPSIYFSILLLLLPYPWLAPFMMRFDAVASAVVSW